ncbi:MAG TPA: hypothetical protein DEQ79_05000, partial [Alphaproteobacteria bacterium]|nr:hypothetical protein [Alphaproteobacteria bacterium]
KARRDPVLRGCRLNDKTGTGMLPHAIPDSGPMVLLPEFWSKENRPAFARPVLSFLYVVVIS